MDPSPGISSLTTILHASGVKTECAVEACLTALHPQPILETGKQLESVLAEDLPADSLGIV
jgi:hypothetical protein